MFHYIPLLDEKWAALHQTYVDWVEKVPQILRFLKGLSEAELQSQFCANWSISCHFITILVVRNRHFHGKKRNFASVLGEISWDHNITILINSLPHSAADIIWEHYFEMNAWRLATMWRITSAINSILKYFQLRQLC